jgi:cbb3-type cytochrome oxidase subunit 3
MMQRVLSHYHLPWLACIGLLIFFVVFLGVTFWAWRQGSRGLYEVVSTLPLDEYQEIRTNQKGAAQ